MFKLKMSRFPLIRPSDALLPLALLASALAGRPDAALSLYKYALLTRLLSLATPLGLRRAFSAQPSMRMARGSVLAALPMQPLGFALALPLIYLLKGGVEDAAVIFAASGMCLNLEHIFYEYLFAAGEKYSAALLRALTSALTFGGLLLTSTAAGDGFFPCRLETVLGACLLSALIAAVAGICFGGPLKRAAPNLRVLRASPWALAQCAVYPAALWALSKAPFSALRGLFTAVPLLAGLAVWHLWRTPFRRSALESRPMNAALAVISAISVALTLVPGAKTAAIAVFVACACAFAMYGRVRERE